MLPRRTFLAAAGGALVAAACGNDNGAAGPDVSVTRPATSVRPDQALNLLPNTFEWYAGVDQRVAVALLRGTSSFPVTKPATLAIGPIDGPLGDPVPAAVHSEGVNPYLRITHRFPSPGTYTVQADYDGQTADLAVKVIDPVEATFPMVGEPLVSTPTPTPADPRGVDPICTRQPVCPLHDVSLDAALQERRPIVVLFSTPALCRSRLCGPVLENLLAVREEAGDAVRFLHVEIFTDLTGKTSAPAVQAFGLSSEPLLLLAGADGVIRHRLDNAYDKREVRELLPTLSA